MDFFLCWTSLCNNNNNVINILLLHTWTVVYIIYWKISVPNIHFLHILCDDLVVYISLSSPCSIELKQSKNHAALQFFMETKIIMSNKLEGKILSLEIDTQSYMYSSIFVGIHFRRGFVAHL